MELKTLALDLGVVKVLDGKADPPAYAPGWYVDTRTGQSVYFDGNTQRFYALQNGIFVPLATWYGAPKQVTVAPGDKLQVTLGFKYTGPAVSAVLSRFSIGTYGTFGLTEDLVGTPSFSIAANLTSTPQDRSASYTFTIPSTVKDDWTDIYVKIWGGTPNIGGSEQFPAYEMGYSYALIIAGATVNITEFTIKDFAKV